MAQTFRSAFNGFNRTDVAHYIEYITNKHNSELTELRGQIAALQTAQDSAAPAQSDLAAENEALKQRIAELEARLASASTAAPAAYPQSQELEAYRRAERTERAARERAESICRQTDSILSGATAKVDNASTQIGTVMEQMRQQLDLLQHAVGTSRQALLDASAAMYAMNPTANSDK